MGSPLQMSRFARFVGADPYVCPCFETAPRRAVAKARHRERSAAIYRLVIRDINPAAIDLNYLLSLALFFGDGVISVIFFDFFGDGALPRNAPIR
jgi:hypothetical protein